MADQPGGRLEAVVLAGGVALGAYQHGALEALLATGIMPERVAATSIGTVNAALLLGGPPAEAAGRLAAFWAAAAFSPPLPRPPSAGWWGADMVERTLGFASAVQTHLAGNPGLFRPRLPPGLFRPRLPPGTDSGGVPSLYDNAPLRRRLQETVDFERLNGGAVRLSLLAVDIASGETVVYDTGAGDRIGPDHILAASGLMPEFAPVAIDGRVLGDGAFRRNAPLHLVLDDPDLRGRDLRVFVIDLFAADGARPATLGAAAERRLDLLFGGQTATTLEHALREDRLRRLVGRLAGSDGEALAEAIDGDRLLLHLAHRSDGREAYSEKMFDFSRAMLETRRDQGRRDMGAALAVPVAADRPGLRVATVRDGVAVWGPTRAGAAQERGPSGDGADRSAR